MTSNCRRIQALVMRIQNDFLDNPALRLTLPRAQARFGVDALTGEAVLGALVDCGRARQNAGRRVREIPSANRAPHRPGSHVRAPAGARLEALASGTRSLSCRRALLGRELIWPWGPERPGSKHTGRGTIRAPSPFNAGVKTMATTKTAHRSDADIFVEARHALDCRPTVPGTVRVHIDEGVATLTGTVRLPAEKADAADAVCHVPGVKDLVNAIIVMPLASPEDFERPDDRDDRGNYEGCHERHRRRPPMRARRPSFAAPMRPLDPVDVQMPP